jgi:hypothetical protein
MDYEDPGWRPALKVSLPFLIVPVVGLRWTLQRSKVDGLTTMRAVFIRLVSSLFVFLVVLPFLAGEGSEGDASWLPYLLVAVGLVSLITVRWVKGRPLAMATIESLAGTYRGSFFIGVGMAMSPALFGFVGFFIDGRLWLYLLGMGFSLIAFAWIAPTRGDIERRQEQIQAQGSSLSLGKALMETPAT